MAFSPTQVVILTPAQQKLVFKLTAVTPAGFLAPTPPGMARDIRLLGLIGLALSDINNAPPREGWTIDSFPQNQYDFLVFATQIWILLMAQMQYSLADVSYTENGYSINLDRTTKIGSAFANFKLMYDAQLTNYKNNILMANGGMGLATPRYQSNLSRFISILGNGAYGWNIP
jgi:hypothetical protein